MHFYKAETILISLLILINMQKCDYMKQKLSLLIVFLYYIFMESVTTLIKYAVRTQCYVKQLTKPKGSSYRQDIDNNKN